ACQPADELLDDCAQVFLPLAGLEIHEDLDHHRDHDLHPPGADDGDGSIEIKKSHPGVCSRRAKAKVFDHFLYCDTRAEGQFGGTSFSLWAPEDKLKLVPPVFCLLLLCYAGSKNKDGMRKIAVVNMKGGVGKTTT